jgi:hypothetical protein
MHSKQFFFFNQTFAQCVFEETQPLPRSQTASSSAKYSSKCSLPKIRRRLARRAFKTRFPKL